MKDLRVTNEELLLLMDAVNLLDSAYVYTHTNECERIREIRERIRIAYED